MFVGFQRKTDSRRKEVVWITLGGQHKAYDVKVLSRQRGVDMELESRTCEAREKARDIASQNVHEEIAR